MLCSNIRLLSYFSHLSFSLEFSPAPFSRAGEVLRLEVVARGQSPDGLAYGSLSRGIML